MSQEALANAIYAKLTNDQSSSSLWSDLSARVYHLNAPPNTALPLLVFRITADQPQAYFSGEDDLDVELQLDLWGSTAAGAAALAAINGKILSLLHGQSLSISGYVDGECQAIDRGRATADGDALRITGRWKIRATAS